MSRTVVIVAADGRLIDVSGTVKEAHPNYAGFARRLLGDDGTSAVLDYGWNGRTSLVLSSGGSSGARITLDAQEVVVPGGLVVGGVPLDNLVEGSIDVEMSGIRGTPGEITVTAEDNPDYPGDGESGESEEPRILYTVGLAPVVTDRLDALEEQLRALVQFDRVYGIGDGLKPVEDPEGARTIVVNIGSGLSFEDDPEGGNRRLAVDPGIVPRYQVGIGDGSGNIVLYDAWG